MLEVSQSPNRFSWRLTTRLPLEVNQELLGRLLVERPLWDPLIAPDPLAPEDSKNPTTLSLLINAGANGDFGAADLDYFRAALKRVTQNRPLIPKLELAWLPNPPGEERPEIHQLGAWLINVPADSNRRVLNLPEPVYLSLRTKTIATLALTALTERLTPPPGAPETRGQKTLIFEEGPALLTAAALTLGSGSITLVTIETTTTQSALTMADRLGRKDDLEIIHSPLSALAKEFDRLWRDEFGLILISLSPYAVGRRLKNFLGWLKSGQGQLILAGLTDGSQSTFILKNAFKAGFSLRSSATDEGLCVLNLYRKAQDPTPIWDWSPGAWLAELTIDEQTFLDEVEAMEKKGQAKTSPKKAESLETAELEPIDLDPEESLAKLEPEVALASQDPPFAP